jgi:hypothetical protein
MRALENLKGHGCQHVKRDIWIPWSRKADRKEVMRSQRGVALTMWKESQQVARIFQFNPSNKNEGNRAQGNYLSLSARRTK